MFPLLEAKCCSSSFVMKMCLLLLCTSVRSQIIRSYWEGPDRLTMVASAATNLPDGRILLWSAYSPFAWRLTGSTETYVAIFDPRTGVSAVTLLQSTNHDMYGSGIAHLGDGRIMMAGGTTRDAVTFYDPSRDRWTTGPRLQTPRGHHSMTPMADGSIFTLGGSSIQGTSVKDGEAWDPVTNSWARKHGIDADAMSGLPDNNGNNHMWLFTTPNGKIFHAGPTTRTHWIDSDAGTYTPSVVRSGTAKFGGNAVMFDIGRVLILGGSSDYNSDGSSESFVVDLNDENNVSIRQVENMDFQRTWCNSVVLPSGEVVVVGGQTISTPSSDSDAVFTAEIWNPDTEEFTMLADMAIERNYHSVALLLEDGRIWSSGGGLCGLLCEDNHPDVEVLTPPYLLDRRGDLAPRPSITSAPSYFVPGVAFSVTIEMPGPTTFVLVRFGAVSHSTNNDQRRIPLTVVRATGREYRLNSPNNAAIVLPGRYYLFAMDKFGVPSMAAHLTYDITRAPLIPLPEETEEHPPTSGPTHVPSMTPSSASSHVPTSSPTLESSTLPQSHAPSQEPSSVTSSTPSLSQTHTPSLTPSASPSVLMKTLVPTSPPSSAPSTAPTLALTHSPSSRPSNTPTLRPSNPPSLSSSTAPTLGATHSPSSRPSDTPTLRPSNPPSLPPSTAPTLGATHSPSSRPSDTPTLRPSNPPSLRPSTTPTLGPTHPPSSRPSTTPTLGPSAAPTDQPIVPGSICTELPTDTYFLLIEKHTGEVVEVESASKYPAAEYEGVNSDLGYEEYFRLDPVGDGKYHIINLNSGLAMRPDGHSHGSRIRQYVIDSTSTIDDWCFFDAGDGDDSYYIINEATGLAIAEEGELRANNVDIGERDQLFTFQISVPNVDGAQPLPVDYGERPTCGNLPTDTYFQIEEKSSHQIVEVEWASFSQAARYIGTSNSNSGREEYFRLESVGNGRYHIINLNSGLAMRRDDSLVRQYIADNASDSDDWCFFASGDGGDDSYYIINEASGLAMELTSIMRAENVDIGDNDQVFIMRPSFDVCPYDPSYGVNDLWCLLAAAFTGL